MMMMNGTPQAKNPSAGTDIFLGVDPRGSPVPEYYRTYDDEYE